MLGKYLLFYMTTDLNWTRLQYLFQQILIANNNYFLICGVIIL